MLAFTDQIIAHERPGQCGSSEALGLAAACALRIWCACSYQPLNKSDALHWRFVFASMAAAAAVYPPPSNAPGQSASGGSTATSSTKASGSSSSTGGGAGSRAPAGMKPSKQQAGLGGASWAAWRRGVPLAPLLGLGGGVAALGFLLASLLRRRRSNAAQRDTKAGAIQAAGVVKRRVNNDLHIMM